MKKVCACLLCFLLIFSTVGAEELTIKNMSDKTANVLLSTVTEPSFGEIGGEWTVIGLARSGADVPEGYYAHYYSETQKHLKEVGGVLDARKYTEYSRLILALTAIGKDPRNVAGYNLLTPLGDFEKTTFQGINGAVWALLALDSLNYPMPEGGATREMYVEEILSAQNADGGWSLSGDVSESDLTGMALCALSKYRETDGVETAVERALTYLSDNQSETGGFLSWGEETAESSAWVLIALAELGISPADERFIQNGNSVLDSLLRFVENGGFRHTAGGEQTVMSTEQGLLALAALLRAEEGKNSLFTMSDAVDLVGDAETEETNRHSDVKVNPVIGEGKSFDDIKGHSAQTAIEDLASRGIINGKTQNSFDPNSTMTRAEFATIVVRALGLPTEGEEPFSDVASSDWFAPFVASAYHYDIVNGVGEGRFHPSGTITREEAAVMVARAAALAGLDHTLSDAEMMDTLTLFTDYVDASSWAKEGLAFCYRAGILSDAEMEILPKTPVLRHEIATMLWNMLREAELL